MVALGFGLWGSNHPRGLVCRCRGSQAENELREVGNPRQKQSELVVQPFVLIENRRKVFKTNVYSIYRAFRKDPYPQNKYMFVAVVAIFELISHLLHDDTTTPTRANEGYADTRVKTATRLRWQRHVFVLWVGLSSGFFPKAYVYIILVFQTFFACSLSAQRVSRQFAWFLSRGSCSQLVFCL